MAGTSAERQKARTIRVSETIEPEPEDDDFIEDPPFDLPTAYEELRAAIIDLDAFASLAEEALEALPHVADPERRRGLSKIFVLVEATAAKARAAMEQADVGLDRLQMAMVERRNEARRG